MGPRWPIAPRPRNVLLVSIDTLRADRLGSYGYAAARTPQLDALASRGLRFDKAWTVTPLTLPAHASILTGTYPAFHGVRDNGGFLLEPERTTLAELLGGAGHRTGAFVGAFVLDARFGLDQGFDRYMDDFDLSANTSGAMDDIQRRGADVVDEALAWLREDPERPFFAWVHLYDPHTPYEAPEPFRSQFPPTVTGAYDAEIAYADAQVGRVLDALAADGRLGRTLVVVLADHGESLGEHGEETHGFFLYEATVRVPLIVAGPGIAAGVRGDPVSPVDVFPTVTAALRLSPSAEVQGRSLLEPPEGARLLLAETFYPRFHYGWSELMAVRDERFKHVRAPRPELYDLRADPGERDDDARTARGRSEALARALDELLGRIARTDARRTPEPIDSDVAERLQALGYLGAGSTRSAEDAERADPKDKIGLYRLLKEALGDQRAGRLDAAVAKVEKAVAEDPGVIEAHALLGTLHMRSHRYDRAEEALRRALALDPANVSAAFNLALTHKEQGRLGDAEAGFERARELEPKGGKALWHLADIQMQTGRLAEAERTLRHALSLKVDRPVFLLKLGECLIEQRRLDEAERTLRDAIGRRPRLRRAHYALGLVHEARGELTDAREAYAAEVERDPQSWAASFNLGKLLLREGKAREAAERLRAAVMASPAFAGGHLYLGKALLDAGDLPGAEAAALEGLARRPEAALRPLGHSVLADVYSRQGRTTDSAREAERARRWEAQATR